MKRVIMLITLGTAAIHPVACHGQFINIDISYKVILNPASGGRPPAATNVAIAQAIARMNELQADYGRGFRFQQVEITEVGGLDDTTGPSRWFNTDFFDDANGEAWQDEMELAAKSDTRYAWNNNAINVYITAGFCGGVCSFPSQIPVPDEIILVGACAAGDGENLSHEIGHYLDLCHTQGCFCGDCATAQTGTCHTQPGDDGIADTLPDLQCWSQDDIANYSYGMPYNSITPEQQEQVDDVFFNLMSYHPSQVRLTELQLDIWTDVASALRRLVTSGRTWFVDRNAGCIVSDGGRACGFLGLGGPYGDVRGGINAASASGGDIVLIRPGTYNESMTITKPVTLRATRAGGVLIGTSVTTVAVLAAQAGQRPQTAPTSNLRAR